MEKRKKIPFVTIFIICAFCALLVFSFFLKENNKNILNLFQKISLEKKQLESEKDQLKTLLEEEAKKETVYRVTVVGDIMLDRGVKTRVKQNSGDYNFPFQFMKSHFSDSDYVFANLEGSVSSVGADTGKPFSFRFEPAVAPAIAAAGIDLVSLANNHILDWGRDSLCATTTHLEKVNVAFVGAGCNNDQAEKSTLVTLGNTKIAFLAYTEFYQGAHATATAPGLSEYSMTKIGEKIKALKENEKVDLVFVSMHWGDEYKPRANNYQVTTGYKLIEMGADLVIGHHPHVKQEIERYKNGWIIYSLGNFIFDQSWSKETMEGLMVDISIQNKKIISLEPIDLLINKDFQPTIEAI